MQARTRFAPPVAVLGWSGLAAILLALSVTTSRAHAAELGCAANGYSPEFRKDYGTSLDSSETWLVIDGDPIKYAAGSRGGVAVWVCQPNGLVRQYYSEDSWGSTLWAEEAPLFRSPYFGAASSLPLVSHTMTDPWRIETVWASADGVELRQTISYAPGDLYVKKRWEVVNSGADALSDVRFYHGGDAFFGGGDSARSWRDPDLGIVYLSNKSFDRSGIMGVYANPATPADHFYGGYYGTGKAAARDGTRLPDTTDSSYVDAGYTLQWNRAALGVGATWLIEAFETWTHPSAVQVLAPPDANTSAGTATLQAFKVHNLDESSAHTVDLTAQNSQAWITGFPLGGAVEVPPLQRVSVPVQVEVPPGVPAGTTAVTSIAATVDGGAPRENAASARLSIIEINYDISSESLDFGTVGIGDSVTRTITVTNLGDPLSISVVGNSDPLTAPFAIAADDCSNTVVAYGESCSISVSMTPTAGGVAADSFNIPIVSPATASHRIEVTGFVPSPPTGHAVSFGLDLFAAGDAASASFSLSNAEVGASYEYSITSSGGGEPVTGAGTVESPNQTFSSIDLRGLGDGMLTLTVVLSNAVGPADPVTATAELDAHAPSGYNAWFDADVYNADSAASAYIDITGGETGATFTYSITSSGGGTPLTGSGTIASPVSHPISDIDLFELPDGELTLSVVLTDSAGNEGEPATAVAVLDKTPPTGYSVVFDQPVIGGADASNVSFTILEGEIGTTLLYAIFSSASAGEHVLDTLPIVSRPQTVTGIDVSSLADGTLSLYAVLTDAVGNAGHDAVATATLDTTPPGAPSRPSLHPDSDTGVSNSDNITSETNPRFDGAADASVTVRVFSDVDGLLGSTTAGGSGSWSLTVEADLSEGVHEITAVAVDAAGNVSPPSPALAVTIDLMPPVAMDDEAETNEDESVQIAVLANDEDVGSSLNPASVRVVQAPVHGSTSVNTATGVITYTPAPDFNGADVFYYTVDDLHGGTSDARAVTVTVHAVNDPPAAVNDAVSTDEDVPIRIAVLANDFDVDGTDEVDPSTIEIVSGPEHGAAEVVDGTILYTPNLDFFGTDELTYTVRDRHKAISNVAFAVINVAGVNDAPNAVDDVAVTDEDQPVEIDVLANDLDVDGVLDAASVRVVDEPDHGEVRVDPVTGTIAYTPDADFFGEDELTYVVRDDEDATSLPAKISIRVESVNDAPVAEDDTAVLLEDTPHAINVLGNDSDVDNAIDPATIEIVTPPEHGTATVDSTTGVITYTPGEHFFGEDALTYRVQDEDGAWSNEATLSFTIESVNDAPLANDDEAATDEDRAVTIAVLENDEDIDGYLDPSSITIVRPPSRGEARVELDGTILYLPNPDVHGEDSFTYKVSDDELGVSNEATVRISIASVNDAPTIEGTPPTQVDAGEPYAFDPAIGDVDGDAVTVSAANLPAWLTLDPETGALRGTPLEMHVGAYPGIVLTVSDGRASAELPAFEIAVRGVLDSDMDGMPDEYELEHGFDPFDPSDAAADADHDGVPNAAELDAGTNPRADDYAPELEVPALVEIDATGLLTPFPTLAPPTAIDGRDGELAAVLSGAVPYLPPGSHTVTWTAADSAGNEAEVAQQIWVHPQISLGRAQVRAEGSSAIVSFYLNGESPTYPVVVEYTIGGTASPGADHDLYPGFVVFEDGELEKRIEVTLVADGIAEGPETIEIGLTGAGNFGARSTQVLTIVEENVAPKVSMTVFQGPRPARLLTADGGAVLFSPEIDDPNPQDLHVLEWWFPQGAAITDMGDTLKALDPSSLQPGVYEMRLVVRDNGMPPLETEIIESFRVIAAAPELAEDVDSDADGLSDALEGYGDADGDGIPDYLDAVSQPNVLAERTSDAGQFLIEADPGVRLVLGDSAQLLGGAGAAILSDETGDVGIEPDSIVNVGGYFDFVARDMPTAGASIAIVIPQRAAIPANPVYRKHDGSWFTFVEDARNRLASARGERGVCPPPGSDEYRPGLTPGHWCVELTIEDGGPNDTDGLANGAIRDPGGVGTVGHVSHTTTGGSGGGGAFGWQGVLGLLGFAAFRKLRQRRRARRPSPNGARRRALRASRVSRLACACAGTFIAFATVFALPAAYADSRFDREALYVAAHVGFADTRISRSDLESDFAARDIEATVTGLDAERGAFELAAGYALSEHWAVEAGYVDLGDVKLSFDAPQLAAGLAAVHPSSADGITVSALHRRLVGQRIVLLARAGVLDWEAAYATDNPLTRVDRATLDGRDWLLGMGAEYSFAPSWALTAEMRHYDLPRKPTRELAIGFRWHVGRRQ